MSRKTTRKTKDGKELSYKVTENGYYIYLDSVMWIHQYEPHIPDSSKTYEENAIMQIEQITGLDEITDREKIENELMQEIMEGVQNG